MNYEILNTIISVISFIILLFTFIYIMLYLKQLSQKKRLLKMLKKLEGEKPSSVEIMETIRDLDMPQRKKKAFAQFASHFWNKNLQTILHDEHNRDKLLRLSRFNMDYMRDKIRRIT
jgi:hypothetical protein